MSFFTRTGEFLIAKSLFLMTSPQNFRRTLTAVQQQPAMRSSPTRGQSGALRVRLSHAIGLVSKDSNGFSDPYVKLILGKEVHKSEIIKKTLNPRWDKVGPLSAAMSPDALAPASGPVPRLSVSLFHSALRTSSSAAISSRSSQPRSTCRRGTGTA